MKKVILQVLINVSSYYEQRYFSTKARHLTYSGVGSVCCSDYLLLQVNSHRSSPFFLGGGGGMDKAEIADKLCPAMPRQISLSTCMRGLDFTLILLEELLDGSFAGHFEGLEIHEKGTEIGKHSEAIAYELCDEHFFYEEVSRHHLQSCLLAALLEQCISVCLSLPTITKLSCISSFDVVISHLAAHLYDVCPFYMLINMSVLLLYKSFDFIMRDATEKNQPSFFY